MLGVGSAEEALDVAPSIADRLGLVLADLSLPGMDGKQMGRELRAAMPQVKIVHMSGNPADASDAAEGHAFLSKPFSRAQLIEIVSRTIGPAC